MRLLVFSDLDGTLLDHDTYDYSPALPVLERLKRNDIPLVLASSKTGAEVARLHADLGLGDAPAIVENGAGFFAPGTEQAGGAEYARIRAALDRLPEVMRASFTGFGDMDVTELMQITGLPADSAAMARDRRFSEPGLWQGSDAGLRDFLAVLGAQGIVARRGGRFLTLSLGRSKADGMADIKARRGADTTIALGDAPNDVEMLETADYGVIIRNDHGAEIPTLTGEATGRIRRTQAPGPAGWAEGLGALLSELGYEE